MKCGKCGKQFDEAMYSGICPKCGYFNNRQGEIDVSRYYSARFEDDGKISANAPAGTASPVYRQGQPDLAPTGQPTGNPYQDSAAYRRYAQEQAERSKKFLNRFYLVCGAIIILCSVISAALLLLRKIATSDIPGTADPGSAGVESGELYDEGDYGQPGGEPDDAGGYGRSGEKAEESDETAEFEWEMADVGQLFDIYDRLFIVDKAEVINTSGFEGMPAGEKLIAVTVKILPESEWGETEADSGGGNNGVFDEPEEGTAATPPIEEEDRISSEIYVSDGLSCKRYLEPYAISELFGGGSVEEEDALKEYDYLGLYSEEGKKGKFFFFVDDGAEKIRISFDERRERYGNPDLRRRVSVPLQIEESGISAESESGEDVKEQEESILSSEWKYDEIPEVQEYDDIFAEGFPVVEDYSAAVVEAPPEGYYVYEYGYAEDWREWDDMEVVEVTWRFANPGDETMNVDAVFTWYEDSAEYEPLYLLEKDEGSVIYGDWRILPYAEHVVLKEYVLVPAGMREMEAIRYPVDGDGIEESVETYPIAF